MIATQNSNLHRISPPAPVHLGISRTANAVKIRAKRLRCKTCDGKVCIGRCRFEKVH